MQREEVISSALWAYEQGYGSIVIQSGEREDREFTSFITELLSEIKTRSHGELGITLSLGEQTEEVYKECLKRRKSLPAPIETSNPTYTKNCLRKPLWERR